MHYHHYTHHRVEPSRPRHVAVIRTPKDLQARVYSFHRRATAVQPLKLLGRTRDRWKPPQVQLTRYPCRQAVVPPHIALVLAGTLPPLVPRRAAILHRPAVLLVT